MVNNGIAKVQHYVPQFILKKFCQGKKPQLWVYDKHEDRAFKSHVKNIASESSFYDFELDDIPVTLETSLSSLEAQVSHLFKRIVKDGSIAFLTEKDRALLSYFFSVQFVRTRRHRESFRHMHEVLKEWFERNGDDVRQLEGFEPPSEGTLKEYGIRALAKAHEFTEHFYNKCWILMKSQPCSPFITSDHPICLQNILAFGPRGNLGLAVQGIEIYFPISKDYCLCMICSSYEQEILTGYERYKRISIEDPIASSMIFKEPFELERLVTGIQEGVAVQAKDDGILNMNSLHVRNSSRFIFSPINDFEMVRDILNEHPDLKTGSKPVAT